MADESAVFASTDGSTPMAHDTDIWWVKGNLLCPPYALVAGQYRLAMALSFSEGNEFRVKFVFFRTERELSHAPSEPFKPV